jgi:hypothetical protein
MKLDTYNKTLLTVIALALSIGALKPFLFPELVARAQAGVAQKTASPTPKIVWEYKTIYRRRSFVSDRTKPEDIGAAGEWTTESTDGKSYVPIDIEKALPEMGVAGWELVAIEARSDYAVANLQGRTATCAGNFCNDTAILAGVAANGATSSDFWIFKRPKQ